MLNRSEILETIEMIDKEHFDVRTITMGLSLFSCIRQTAKETAKCVYDLICRRAEKIVPVGEELEREYGVPIVNKRISITPASFLTANFPGKKWSSRGRSTRRQRRWAWIFWADIPRSSIRE